MGASIGPGDKDHELSKSAPAQLSGCLQGQQQGIALDRILTWALLNYSGTVHLEPDTRFVVGLHQLALADTSRCNSRTGRDTPLVALLQESRALSSKLRTRRRACPTTQLARLLQAPPSPNSAPYKWQTCLPARSWWLAKSQTCQQWPLGPTPVDGRRPRRPE